MDKHLDQFRRPSPEARIWWFPDTTTVPAKDTTMLTAVTAGPEYKVVDRSKSPARSPRDLLARVQVIVVESRQQMRCTYHDGHEEVVVSPSEILYLRNYALENPELRGKVQGVDWQQEEARHAHNAARLVRRHRDRGDR